MAYSLPGPLGLARGGFEVLYVEMNHWINLLDCITVVEFTSIKVANVYGSFSSVCVCGRGGGLGPKSINKGDSDPK